jgi:hypothetical protein
MRIDVSDELSDQCRFVFIRGWDFSVTSVSFVVKSLLAVRELSREMERSIVGFGFEQDFAGRDVSCR